jgi:hypothetical protein
MGLRYVILRHEGVESPHFDLMFELEPGAALATWRSPDWPPTCSVERIADHRREYLGYEGPVSNDRGYVRRVEAGTYEWVQGFELPVLAFTLSGGTNRTLFLRRVSETGWLGCLQESA